MIAIKIEKSSTTTRNSFGKILKISIGKYMPLSVSFLPLGEDTRAACVFTASWVPLDATTENVVVDRSSAIRADAHVPSSDGLQAGTAL